MRRKERICEKISQYAVTSLLYEVSATPKPGLVDRINQGAHKDMDFYSFMASSASLSPYFYKCALKGAENNGADLHELFNELRPIGMEAEKTMFLATGGTNTHKGLIFSLGIISAATASLYANSFETKYDIDRICETIAKMTKGVCNRELDQMNKADNFSHGEIIFKKYGSKGIRGEVENGFSTVRLHSLSKFNEMISLDENKMNDVFVQTLLHIMAVNEDTNVLSRHNNVVLEYVKDFAQKALNHGGIFTPEGKELINKMDSDFINANISPGGSADLLAVTIMFHLLSK